MSSRVALKLVASALLTVAAAGPVQAAVRCPPMVEGKPLRALGGGRLYYGPIEDNMALAPDGTQQGQGGWVNRWTFPGGAAGTTLVCRYEGIQTPQHVRLTPNITSCRQDVRSFVCQ